MSGRATDTPDFSITNQQSDSSNAAPVEWRQRNVDHFEAQQTHLDGRQAQIHSAMPGNIVSFDANAMTVVVQPAIQGLFTQPDATRKPITIQNIPDVPVFFPAGGGYTLTFPIKAGDECLIVFSERNIDNWFQHGGTMPPADLRMHDITDAFALVGLRNTTRPLSTAPTATATSNNVNTSNVQLRADDGKRYVEIDNSNDKITSAAGATTVVIDNQNAKITAAASGTTMVIDNKSGAITLTAANGITLDTPAVTVTGVINVNGKGGSGTVGTFNGTIIATDDVIARTVSGLNHVHTGVQPGGGDTGKPVP